MVYCKRSCEFVSIQNQLTISFYHILVSTICFLMFFNCCSKNHMTWDADRNHVTTGWIKNCSPLSWAKRLAGPEAMASLSALTRNFASQSALEDILKELSERPETELHSRRGIKRAREAFVDVETPYGKLLVYVPVKLEATKTEPEVEIRFPFVNPWAILYHLCREGEEYAAFLKAKHDLVPSNYGSRWSVICYADEVSAGNVLRHNNLRKTQVGSKRCFVLFCFPRTLCLEDSM